jgi:hypothetical protein
MNADFFAMLAGLLLSLLFSYIPGFSGWFEKLDGIQKRLVMLGLLALVAIGLVVATCAGFASDLGLQATCDRSGLVSVIWAFMLALIANQSTYQITARKPEPIGYNDYPEM